MERWSENGKYKSRNEKKNTNMLPINVEPKTSKKKVYIRNCMAGSTRSSSNWMVNIHVCYNCAFAEGKNIHIITATTEAQTYYAYDSTVWAAIATERENNL